MRDMFERFTERARNAVVLAQEEARALGHAHIGTEHLLLGLIRTENGLAARALAALGVRFEETRAQIVRLVGSGEPTTTPQIPFTAGAKTVLELALREALGLGHNYIGTEHILLGIAREDSGVAARVLLDFGADPERIRGAVMTELAGRRIQVARGSDAPFASWLGRLLLNAAAEAQGGRRPDGGDLLLALARDRDDVAGRALAELGASEEQVRAAVARAREASSGDD